jgi:hypothetical protein
MMDVPHGAVHEGPKRVFRNQARPKGSMAIEYVIEKTLSFCTKYIQ